ncbi:MAG: hypothetical protein ACI936_004248 [Paraglaciecola sp.]|jgi:hypothetical protein
MILKHAFQFMNDIKARFLIGQLNPNTVVLTWIARLQAGRPQLRKLKVGPESIL